MIPQIFTQICQVYGCLKLLGLTRNTMVIEYSRKVLCTDWMRLISSNNYITLNIYLND
jgi:hypothetical protein